MKVWITVTYGGYVEVDTKEEFKEIERLVEDNDVDKILSCDTFTSTHYEGDCWRDNYE